LIHKIRPIENKDFLNTLDKLILLSHSESSIVELTYEQKTMLEMSEQDKKDEKLISQKAMHKRNLKGLNQM
jgi:hypothetical protein